MTARYRVTQHYMAYSDGQQWGPWSPGDEVELDDDRAAWVNRDAPGTLEQPQEQEHGEDQPADDHGESDGDEGREQEPADDAAGEPDSEQGQESDGGNESTTKATSSSQRSAQRKGGKGGKRA